MLFSGSNHGRAVIDYLRALCVSECAGQAVNQEDHRGRQGFQRGAPL